MTLAADGSFVVRTPTQHVSLLPLDRRWLDHQDTSTTEKTGLRGQLPIQSRDLQMKTMMPKMETMPKMTMASSKSESRFLQMTMETTPKMTMKPMEAKMSSKSESRILQMTMEMMPKMTMKPKSEAR
jgi:hypothetical protein